ncbi:chaplin family protein [Streptomyces sp. NPDC059582]|uniref:chaplin n=1 Tax=Streptomyces sp. NPDC059582 TaxID=3346875 RepID=UPI00369055AB
MRRVTRNGVIAVAAASGAMAVTIPAYAGSAADGSAAGSPGLISGNAIQLPVHVPVNVCGNTVNVAGLLNPAAGNTCANRDSAGSGAVRAGAPGRAASGRGASDRAAAPGGAAAQGGAEAHGEAADSPGLLSGNGLELPVHLPVNVSGNAVTVVGAGNASVGNESTNTSVEPPAEPVQPTTPVDRVVPPTPQKPRSMSYDSGETVTSLAHTGADQTLPALAGSAALVLGGAALYRRFRPQADR